MPSALRSAAIFAFVSALAALSMPGCSQQGEGERCDSAKNGDDDCSGGLTCVAVGELLDQATDRCCPAANTENDSRCKRGTKAPGGTSSGGTNAGGTNAGGTNAGGGEGGAADAEVPGGGTSTGGTSTGGTSSEPAEAGAGGGLVETGDGGTSNQASAGSPATNEAGAGVGGAG